MEDLTSKLKKLRNNFAHQENMPAYCIFENKAIDEIVKNLPTTLDELADVKGFKEKRIEKYGSAIVELVSSYLEENNIEKQEINFSNPDNVLKILLSKDIDYSEILNLSKKLIKDIEQEHISQKNTKFTPITQCILECYKIINNFDCEKWISKNNFEGELKENQQPVIFERLNEEDGICHYEMYNFSQIEYIEETKKISLEEIKNKPKEEDDQTTKKIIKLAKSGANLFITGHAGTGKSYILQKLKEKFKKQLAITSTTGIAAVNVKGQTIHSWAGVGLCKKPVDIMTKDIISKKPTIKKRIEKCKMLAIDEVSMLNIQTFEYIDSVFRIIRETDEPFGGIQVIFIGDFFQLPPVEKEESEIKYCFESPIWKDLNFTNIILEKNYRQNEKNFITALSHMRANILDDNDIALLNQRNNEVYNTDSDMLHIFSTNEEADNYNREKFDALEYKIQNFSSDDGVLRGDDYIYNNFSENENKIIEIFNKSCRVNKTLELKLGARVMLLVNLDFDKGLINGSCGTIKAFNLDSITVLFDNGIEKDITREAFEYFYNDKPIALRRQYPLKLAYAITIHKSQGMTLDKLFVDCKRIFEKGQAYVAMSRVKTLDGLYLANFSKDRVKADEKVVEFYKNLQ